MDKKRICLATAVGFTVGYLTKVLIDSRQQVTPEQALKHAKEMFKKVGPISGSWIYMKPEEVTKNGLLYNAYRGGVTRTIDGENKPYEFYVDVDTGAVISTAESS
ncbi:MAG TPA: PepSY domain-containing protein [Bacillota bacterium]